MQAKWHIAALGLLALQLAAGAGAGAAQPSEFDVKAAFLLNFARFVEWGEGQLSNSPIAVCVVGEDPFGAALDQAFDGESVGTRRIAPRRLRALEGRGCDVAYISKSHRDAAKTLAEIPAGVLTVGEGEAFLREGGMIAFVTENRRVRFDINMAAARNGRVRLSSRLLQVARSVK